MVYSRTLLCLTARQRHLFQRYQNLLVKVRVGKINRRRLRLLNRYRNRLVLMGLAGFLNMEAPTAQVCDNTKTFFTHFGTARDEVAINPVGTFVILYEETPRLYFNRYDMSGTQLGPTTEVGPAPGTNEIKRHGRVAMDGDGDFVISWELYNDYNFEYEAFFQRYDVTGSTVGSPIPIISGSTFYAPQPEVGMDADGDFIITWEESGVSAQRYTAAGFKVGPVINIPSSSNPLVAVDPNGSFVISHKPSSSSKSELAHYTMDGQLITTTTSDLANIIDLDINESGEYAASASFGVEVYDAGSNLISTISNSCDAVAIDSEGDVTLVWDATNSNGYSDVFAQTYTRYGSPLNDALLVFEDYGLAPNLVLTESGLLITYGDFDLDERYVKLYDCIIDPVHCTSGEQEEFVNTVFQSTQDEADIAMDADGDYVIVWTSNTATNSDEIYGQRYNADGVKQGSELVINQVAAGVQDIPAVAMDANGNFAVAWQSGTGGGAHMRLFDALGSPITNNIALDLDGYAPTVARHANGKIIVSWVNDGDDLFIHRFAPDGSAIGSTESISFSERQMDVSVNASGTYILVWMESGNTFENKDIFAQLYNKDDDPIGGIRTIANSADVELHPTVGIDDQGHFAISFMRSNEIVVKRYDDSGAFLDETQVTSNGSRPDIAMDAAGNFIITWEAQDGSSDGIFYRRYLKDGTALDLIPANSYTANAQKNPAIAMDRDGDFAMAWESTGPYGALTDIYQRNYQCCARAFSDATGNQLMGTASVDTETSADYLIESIQLLDGGQVHYRANLCIELLSGFEVTGGTVFEATMDGCDY